MYSKYIASLLKIHSNSEIGTLKQCTWYCLGQAWWTYGTRVQNGKQKQFLDTWHLVFSQIFLFPLPNQCLYTVNNICIYTHIYCVQTIGIIVATKWHCSETFFHNLEPCKVLIGYLSLGHQEWQSLGEYVTLDRGLYSLVFKQKVVAAQLLPHFVP